MARTPPLERFNRKWKEDKDGCHIWTAGVNRTTEYGFFQPTAEESTQNPQRWIWVVSHPESGPPERVRATCEKKLCVRVDHLEGVTHKQSVALRDSGGRGRRNYPLGKLTFTDAEEIRRRYNGVGDTEMLAEEFGVTPITIYRVVKGLAHTSPKYGRSKLTSDQVRKIRWLYRGGQGESIEKLSGMFDVRPRTVHNIVNFVTWKFI